VWGELQIFHSKIIPRFILEHPHQALQNFL
jgi:hypothetical protein